MEREALSHRDKSRPESSRDENVEASGLGQTRSIPSLLSEFTAMSFQDNLRVDGAA
ncbi:hypothetical protein K0M31_017841 [Melipona bicolor]|uniref:Uncharacterized protein n=1 Tax=Melipona bicolor TaxID=60889 RepID=A0AA40G5M0_9HYME|nr:hypothetical protein K0M31_017841 [Melipona bicolor]